MLHQVQQARAVQPFITGQTNRQGYLKNAFVPGTEGGRYMVILWRKPPGMQAECWLDTPGGAVVCQVAAGAVCYHILAAAIFAGAGRKISFCQCAQSARRLAHIGGSKVFPLVSRHCGKTVWMVVSTNDAGT